MVSSGSTESKNLQKSILNFKLYIFKMKYIQSEFQQAG